MNLQQIMLFEAVVEEGSYTRAGEREGYTQSRVTQIMKALEDEVGFSLFVKSHQGVSLTKSGRLLLPRMRRVLSDMHKLEAEIDSLHGLQEGSLRIGTHISCSVNWLPEIMRKFQEKYPGIRLAILENGQQDILSDLRARRADVGLISCPYEEADIQFIPLIEDPMVVIFPSDDEFAKYDIVPGDELGSRRFIISDLNFDSDAGRILLERGMEDNVLFTLRNDTAITSMVRHGLGISILPELVLHGIDMTGLEYRKLSFNPVRTLGVGFLSEDELGPVEKVFIRELKKLVCEKDENS
ncbi:MAG: LysR family transcriptional regulator [Eubacterium sp.]